MKHSIHLAYVVGAFLLPSVLFGQTLKITGSKEHVVPIKNRDAVLKAADQYLASSASEKAVVTANAPIQDPFTLEDETKVEQVVVAESGPIKTPEVRKVVYDDASVLQAIAQSFSKQIRGNLARGSTYYLQLQGGGLLKSGVSFPARIPQIPDQVFNVTLSDVSLDGYTLELRDETIRVAFEENSEDGVKFFK